VFGLPGRKLAVTIERIPEPAMAHDVVDRSEAIVGTADRRFEERVLAIPVIAGGEDLKELVVPH
jgi:hypothetical protein